MARKFALLSFTVLFLN